MRTRGMRHVAGAEQPRSGAYDADIVILTDRFAMPPGPGTLQSPDIMFIDLVEWRVAGTSLVATHLGPVRWRPGIGSRRGCLCIDGSRAEDQGQHGGKNAQWTHRSGRTPLVVK